MAGLKYKVYRRISVHSELMATVKHAEDAAAMAALLGDGAQVKANGRVVWTQNAAPEQVLSYDAAAATIHEREAAHQAEAMAKYQAAGTVVR